MVATPSSDGGIIPHTRGARARDWRYLLVRGIIPAYAGSTTVPFELYIKAGDHPRIRGEHVERVEDNCDARGSSPHTRGAPPGASPQRWAAGIIPAYAGSTQAASPSLTARRDHPRIRGEHAYFSRQTSVVMGSSPHTRGARFRGQDFRLRRGIIPAYAGSTSRVSGCRAFRRDHPRIRGEH